MKTFDVPLRELTELVARRVADKEGLDGVYRFGLTFSCDARTKTVESVTLEVEEKGVDYT